MRSGEQKQSVSPDSSLGGLRLRIATEPSYLARLAAVYSDPIRAKIVAELYMREMSPTQFFEAFGGGSASKVRWHFKELTGHGWLRKVRTESRRTAGRPQHLYRATEPPVIDDETWANLPLSIRAWFSWRTLSQIWERSQESMTAGTFDARPDRHLTVTTLSLDQRGWQEQIQAMNECFTSLDQEQVDAKIRLQASGEDPVIAIVALAGFESPSGRSPDLDPGGERSAVDARRRWKSDIPFFTRLAKVFADPLMLTIVAELNGAAMSATQLAVKIGGASVYGFDRRCKLLAELGWLEHVGAKTGGRRRGATEHFYRAVGPIVYDTDLWRGVSDSEKGRLSRETLQQAFEKATEALRTSTFDARPERHLTWRPLCLDELGWTQVIALLDGYFESLFVAQDSARRRLQASKETPIASTFFLAGFQAAPSGGKLWVP